MPPKHSSPGKQSAFVRHCTHSCVSALQIGSSADQSESTVQATQIPFETRQTRAGQSASVKHCVHMALVTSHLGYSVATAQSASVEQLGTHALEYPKCDVTSAMCTQCL